MKALAELAQAVIDGNHARAGELTQQVIAQDVPPKTILDDGLIAGMNVVGERFRLHEIFLPDVLLAAKAM
jgi:5-methyltetrahydrofolate--homocysteine methyltransferase